jgi:hypothetical protein
MPSTQHHSGRPAWARLTAGLLVALACSTEPSVPVTLPAGAVAFEPDARYRDWWIRTEACAGSTGDFDAVEWYTVPSARTMATDIGEKVGLWIWQDDRRIIVLAGKYLDHELVVRHEMLHDLLTRAGHPGAYFERRCGLTWESWQPERSP